jgi:hypothetical protein
MVNLRSRSRDAGQNATGLCGSRQNWLETAPGKRSAESCGGPPGEPVREVARDAPEGASDRDPGRSGDQVSPSMYAKMAPSGWRGDQAAAVGGRRRSLEHLARDTAGATARGPHLCPDRPPIKIADCARFLCVRRAEGGAASARLVVCLRLTWRRLRPSAGHLAALSSVDAQPQGASLLRLAMHPPENRSHHRIADRPPEAPYGDPGPPF